MLQNLSKNSSIFGVQNYIQQEKLEQS